MNKFTPTEIVHSIRHINCMSMKDFKNTFGNEADYFYNKLHDQDEGIQIAKFLMALDTHAINLLFKHCREHLEEYSE